MIKRTTRTTELGLRILAGQERRATITAVCIERAEFERDFAGKPLVAFDREQIWRMATRYLGDTDVDISVGFVKACQDTLPYWKRAVAAQQ